MTTNAKRLKDDWSGYCRGGNHRFCHEMYETPSAMLRCPCPCHVEEMTGAASSVEAKTMVAKVMKAKVMVPKEDRSAIVDKFTGKIMVKKSYRGHCRSST